jgi:ribulose-5-phosphate 4-epimerase/fuculose-1-phosphate aldolase
VVAGKSLEDAVYTMEELEETAKLSLVLAGQQLSLLTADQIADLQQTFPN